MAVQNLQQNEGTAARRRVYLKLVDASDGITVETGEAGGTPQISINGGSYTNTISTLVGISSAVNGSYYVELTVTEIATPGKILIRYKSANTAEFEDVIDIQKTELTSNDQLKQLIIVLSRKIDFIVQLLKFKEDKEIGALSDLTEE